LPTEDTFPGIELHPSCFPSLAVIGDDWCPMRDVAESNGIDCV
jgi:hypothetical protein